MNSKILEFKIKEEKRQAELDKQRRGYKVENCSRKQKIFAEFKNKHLVVANKCNYEEWLRLWLQENNITHYYNYNFPDDNYLATSDFVLDVGYYGVESFNIIVPKGIKYKIIELGHCNIYDLNNTTCTGGWVPAYNNLDV